MIAALVVAAAALSSRIDAIAHRVLTEAPAAGATVAVRSHGKLVALKGYGFANLELRTPAGPETVYRIGSLTKQFTAAAILQQVEAGKLRLDEELSEALPSFPANGRHITLAQLLSHTSGIANYTALGPKFRDRSREDLTPAEVMALFASEPARFEPGAKFEYSNSNYHLLGMILERVTGLSYAEALARNVFPKAGLEHTRYCSTPPIIPNRAAGYESRGPALENATFLAMSIPFAAGGLCSTAGDLLKWTAALEEGRVVSKESYRLMITPHPPAKEYGFGLGQADLGGHRSIQHGGGINGFNSMLMRFPADDLTIVVLANTGGEPATAIAEGIARAALGLPEPVVRDLPLDRATLGRCVGTYVTPGKQRISVAAAGGKLQLFPEKDPADTTVLLFQGSGDFIVKGSSQHVRCGEKALCLGDETHCFAEFVRAE